MSDPPTPSELLEAVRGLAVQYETSASATENLTAEVGRRKRETRWVALTVCVIVAIVSTGAGVIRNQDNKREADRRAVLAAQIFTQRESQVQGCQRGNDQRATLRRVITESYEPSTPLTSIPPEFAELVAESAKRAIAKRDSLLSLPGVQPVDCAAAFPPPPGEGK